MAVLVGAGEIVRDFGLSIAAVQARSLSQGQKSNLFWLNLGIGAALGLGLAALGRPLAAIYGRPELIGIAEALAVIFVLNGAAAQFRADLVRRMRFAAISGANVCGALVGTGLAVVLAMLDPSYWALVAGLVTTAAVGLVYVSLIAHWRPGPIDRGAAMGSLLRFGGSNALVHLLNYASKSVAPLALGFFGSASSAGLYDRSTQAVLVPMNQINAPATDVALPVLSRLQDETSTFMEFLRRGQAALAVSAGTALAVLFVYAKPIVQVLLGTQWTSAVPIIRVLAVAALLECLGFVVYWVFISRGLGGPLLRYALAGRPVIIATTVAGSYWGATGAATGYLIGQAFLWPLSLWWASRASGLSLGVLMRNGILWLLTLAVSVASALLMVRAFEGFGAAVAFGVSLLGFAIGLVLAYCTVPGVRREIVDLQVLLRAVRGR